MDSNDESREAVIKSAFVTKNDEDFPLEEPVHKNTEVAPIFELEFASYDPFPKTEIIEQIKQEIRSDILDNIEHISTITKSDVKNSKPKGTTRTQFINVGHAVAYEDTEDILLVTDFEQLEMIVR